jgi:hypothetical protein
MWIIRGRARAFRVGSEERSAATRIAVGIGRVVEAIVNQVVREGFVAGGACAVPVPSHTARLF